MKWGFKLLTISCSASLATARVPPVAKRARAVASTPALTVSPPPIPTGGLGKLAIITTTTDVGGMCGTHYELSYPNGLNTYNVVCPPHTTNTCVITGPDYGQCQQLTCTDPPYSTSSCSKGLHLKPTQYGSQGCSTYACIICPIDDCWCNYLPGGPYTYSATTKPDGCRGCTCVPVAATTSSTTSAPTPTLTDIST